MYHSITFYDADGKQYNTWSNWHLIPTSRPIISHPDPQIVTVPLPGRSGSIDITNYLYSKPIYANRNGSLQFYAMEGYNDYRVMQIELYKTLHGKKLKFVFEDDPDYYYVGRFTVALWKNEASRPNINITYTAEPYKYDFKTNARITDDF